MVRYSATIFLSAFLLFQVQPLVGKFILPWFGGSPAVWTTCMLFFQVVLLLGYAYAHFTSIRLSPRRQAAVHLALLAVSLYFLPIAPDGDRWKPSGESIPAGRILALLGMTIGLPYFLLSSTGPLLQESFRRETARAPYRLYSLSNAGSLLALLTYPFVFEPQLTLRLQIVVWSSGYALFVALCAFCVWRSARVPEAVAEPAKRASKDKRRADERPQVGAILAWLSLAACGSVMLLATTNQVTQEVPPVPFLWVAPLAVYLVSFIICFDHDRWYQRGLFFPLLLVAASLSGYAFWYGNQLPLWQQMAIYPLTLFACCMVCHGELVRIKPAPRYATFFYLMVAAGGAAGGVLVAVVAPLLLPDFWEFKIGLGTTVALAVVAFWLSETRTRLPRWVLAGSGLTILAVALVGIALWNRRAATEATIVDRLTLRNFYGVLRVRDNSSAEDPNGPRRLLVHGHIDHGLQYRDSEKRRWPTTYYNATSGVGLAINQHPNRAAPDPANRALRIGVVGLGAGTLAAAAQPGDHLRFYEIDPEVVKIASNWFSYLKESKAADIQVFLGDARISMERQIAEAHPQQFDVLVIDAFSSDAIPMHLLTLECVKLYGEHLKPDGILCVHLSNLFLELSSVVRGIAKELDCPCVFVEAASDYASGAYYSCWGLLSRNQSFLSDPAVLGAIARTRRMDFPPVLWTDDYGSLWHVLRDVQQWSAPAGR